MAQSATASSRGELLYTTHCIACHTTQVHWRDKRLVKDWASLQGQVFRWQNNTGLGWTVEDINEVARYLNAQFYRFPEPGAISRAPRCRVKSPALTVTSPRKSRIWSHCGVWPGGYPYTRANWFCDTGAMNKWVKRGIYAAIVLAVVGGGALAVSHQKKKANEAPKFRTQAVDRGPITQAILASGTLQPVVSVSVGTQVSGTVSERLADFNDRVKKGQVLVKLDPALLQARIRQANAQLGSARASLSVASANYERNQRLQSQGFLSGAAIEQSKRELEAAQANVEVSKAQLDSATTDLNNSIVRAPIDGVIIKRNIDVGQTVAASFQTPELFQIAQDLKRMQIYTNVSEADVGLIREGQLVRFSVDAFQDREFEGKVEQFRLNSTSTSGVVTYNIVISVANPDELLKPGMTAQTRIVVASKNDVVRIPTAALRFKPDEDAAAKKRGQENKKPGEAAKEPVPKPAAKAEPTDDGVLSTTRAGARLFRVYTVGADNTPKVHDVTIGISNTRFTEMVTGDIKPDDELITRSLVAAQGAPN
jgi:HlyD family secretion protein